MECEPRENDMLYGPSNRSWTMFKTIKNFIYTRNRTGFSPVTKTLMLMTGTAGLCVALQIYGGNEKTWKRIVMPIMHRIDPERAHRLSIKLASYGIVPMVQPDSVEVDSYLVTFFRLRMTF